MKTDASAKVLIDTSAWISFFRKDPFCHGVVSALIDEDRVACCGIILAELMQGAKSDKEIQNLKGFFMVFEFPDEPLTLWERAGELSYKLRLSGGSPGLADCYLAVVAKANSYSILTLDKHFIALSKETGVRII